MLKKFYLSLFILLFHANNNNLYFFKYTKAQVIHNCRAKVSGSISSFAFFQKSTRTTLIEHISSREQGVSASNIQHSYLSNMNIEGLKVYW